MIQYEDAKHFCDSNSLPDRTGWVLFMLGTTPGLKPVAFGWCTVLPHCFQPFRVEAIHMDTGEQLKTAGLGGRQRWEAV